ncbi:MAG: OmpA family protein, partial [Deltaproteobacteria bacterium]
RASISALCIAGAVSAAARAQDVSSADDQETLLGVIEVLPDRLVPNAAPDDSRSPDDLFASAISELQHERFSEARRLLELFVVRDPQHPSVPEARRHLSELYQLDAQTPKRPAPAETAAMPEPTAVAPTARVVSGARPVGGRLEDNFMLEAGDRVFFAPRSAELGSRARSVLSAQARWLKRNASLSAVVEGHVDDPSLDSDGVRRLAEERAQAVFRRLVEEGVSADRIAVSPQGKSRPVATCASPECAAQNRRAVTVLTAQRVSELPAADAENASRRP